MLCIFFMESSICLRLLLFLNNICREYTSVKLFNTLVDDIQIISKPIYITFNILTQKKRSIDTNCFILYLHFACTFVLYTNTM
jgi:hypothetical protein